MNFLLVFIGGGIGSLLRYGLGISFQRVVPGLPLATFLANFLACLVFAMAVWIGHLKAWNSSSLKLLLLTGFCGGLSTFSTFSYETFLLFKQGLYLYSLLNIFFSLICCLLIFYIFDLQTP